MGRSGQSGGAVVAVFRDEGISGATGRAKRPGLDALLKGLASREFNIVAAWSVCRLGRSLSDLIGLLGELRSRDIDLYLHQQALDTSTPSGKMLFGMLGVFSEFKRTMIRDRVMAGLDRARSSGKRLGRPRTTPFKIDRIRAALGCRSGCARDSAAARQAAVTAGAMNSRPMRVHSDPATAWSPHYEFRETARSASHRPIYRAMSRSPANRSIAARTYRVARSDIHRRPVAVPITAPPSTLIA